VAVANGSGSFNWNTTAVTSGTYYLAGYVINSSTPTFSHLTQSITVAAALALSAPSGGNRTFGGATLNDPQELAPIVAEAMTRLSKLPGSGPLPAGVSIRIADLPGNLLGKTIGKTVVIDRDAAGYGWFLDPTPHDDSEFTALAGGLLAARPGTAADRRADLLTAVMHEMGHVLGNRDESATNRDLMGAMLPLGIRRNPSA
jgi:hypothetical protein